jgi:hypothetical protein
MQRSSKPPYKFLQTKYDNTDTTIFVCLQMVQESLSLFMFLLQVKEKEEALERLE